LEKVKMDQKKRQPEHISEAIEQNKKIKLEDNLDTNKACEANSKEADQGISSKDIKKGKDTKETKEKLKKKIEELAKEKDDYKDKYIRKLAEFDNYRKRIEKEREEYYCFPTTEVIKLLLPVIDSYESALKMDCKYTEDNFKEGIELLYRQMMDILKSLGLEGIPALGEQFDPNIHQAVAREDSNSYKDNEIIEEMQKGYMFRNKLLRASLVKVAINKEEKETKKESKRAEKE